MILLHAYTVVQGHILAYPMAKSDIENDDRIRAAVGILAERVRRTVKRIHASTVLFADRATDHGSGWTSSGSTATISCRLTVVQPKLRRHQYCIKLYCMKNSPPFYPILAHSIEPHGCLEFNLARSRSADTILVTLEPEQSGDALTDFLDKHRRQNMKTCYSAS